MSFPRDINLFVLNYDRAIRVCKGDDILVTLTLIQKDGTESKLLSCPIMQIPFDTPLVRRVLSAEEPCDE